MIGRSKLILNKSVSGAGAKEGQGWAPGSAFAGRSERAFGDKVDLDSPWKEHISPPILHLSLPKIPSSEMYKSPSDNGCRGWWEGGYLCDFIFNSPCPLKSCA